MEYIEEFFSCDGCESRDFKRIYNFSLRFHGVNFSDELIYDRVTDEIYQCARCKKTFTLEQIEEGLNKIKRRHRAKRNDA